MYFSIQQSTADRGYSSNENYEYLKGKNIKSFIPLKESSGGQGGLSKREFKYDRQNDCYICPENKPLYRVGVNRQKRGILYKIADKSCITCPLKAQCVPNGKARNIMRSEFEDDRSLVREKMQTEYFKSKLDERMWKMEGLFAEAKNNHGLRRAKYRGRRKVQIQVYMTAFVQNLKRLISKPIEGSDWIIGHILDQIWACGFFNKRHFIFTQI